MMKLKQYSKNLAKAALSNFILFILIFACGCSSSTTPTYTKETIASGIEDLAKKELKLDIKTKLFENTLWIYLPVEDIFVKAEKPKKSTELFKIEQNKNEFKNAALNIEYAIKTVPKKEQTEDYDVNKNVSEKLGSVWRVVRRVLFSLDHKRQGPQFIVIVIADTKAGFDIRTVIYTLDLKKVSYGLISNDEYQHRTVQETNIDPKIINDKTGKYLIYKDVLLSDFIAAQIQQRIRLKFQKPELTNPKKVNIDKEIQKIAAFTLRTYGFKDFGEVKLHNLLTNKKVTLNRAAILLGSDD
ncbi:MAG: hypothetical protein MUC39_00975 [Candidatus Omnitrophica bacterium]|jgi:hypothetical protein|nr:hypothetical protein [Candidatus Omnitrophota bacterium]